GQKCPHAERCYVFQARRRAVDADVVIVNYHLFFADLRIRSSSVGDTGAAVLPRYDAVIFDEAHGVEEMATDHFGASLSSHRVLERAREAQRASTVNVKAIAAQGVALRLEREGARYFAAAAACRPVDSLRPAWVAPRGKRKGLLPEMDDARWAI